MAAAVPLILRTKYTLLSNYIDHAKHYIWVHVLVGLMVILILVGGGTAFFYMLFSYLMGQEVFGPPLMDRLLGMLLLAFFSMLVFSNLIITLSTTYMSKEIEFFMHSPLSYNSIFTVKLIESIVYSSWAFAILSLPIFVAFGEARHVGILFYPMVIGLIVPFLIIPAGIGSFLTILLSAYFPPKKTRMLCLVLAVVTIGSMVAIMRLMGIQNIFFSGVSDSASLFSFMGVGSLPFLPSYWVSQGLIAAGEGLYNTYLYWFLVLLSTSMMSVQICYWLVPRLYYKGWCLARESGNGGITKRRGALFRMFDRILSLLPQQVKALISKDTKTFWRDPAQWTQLIILLGLLFIYIGNLKSAVEFSKGINFVIPRWKTILSFFNMGATCFILSIVTTRFVYPMLSLEGKQFWVIGLAPLHRNRLIWEKYVLCAICSLLMTQSLMLFSNLVLGISTFMIVLSSAILFVMTFGLTSLAVGLGAMMPNFREDNPARIANGLGGTLNVILSLIYIGVIIALVIYPTYAYTMDILWDIPNWQQMVSNRVLLVVMINLLTIMLPLYFGLKKWENLEF